MSNKIKQIEVGNDFNINGNDNQFTNKQNKQNNIDNSKNIDKSNQTINKIYKVTKEPKRLSKEQIEQLKQITMRPHLKDRVNQYIECYGYEVGNYRNSIDRHTIINLVDANGNKFAADHVQVDFKHYIYDYTDDEGHYVKIKGYVKEYPKNGKVDYTIEITEKVKVMLSRYIAVDNIVDYEDLTKEDIKNINKLLSTGNMTKIYDLIEAIQNEINVLTEYLFSEDYIYHYIICQYFLGQAVYKMYNGKLRDQGFCEVMVLDILYILCNVYYQLTTSSYISLTDSLFTVIQSCNIIQHVQSYTNVEDNPGFIDFCKERLGTSRSRKSKKIWNEFVLWRYSNFGKQRPNVNNWSKKDLITTSYLVIKRFM